MIKSKMIHINVLLITSRKNALPKFQVMRIGELVTQTVTISCLHKASNGFSQKHTTLCRAPSDGNAYVLNCNKDTQTRQSHAFKDKLSSDILYYR